MSHFLTFIKPWKSTIKTDQLLLLSYSTTTLLLTIS